MKRKLYRNLLEEARGYGLTVIEKDFRSKAAGLCKGRTIGISSSINSYEERAEILAEEMAHCLFTVGNILDTRNALNWLQERIARFLAERRIKGEPFPIHLAPPGSYGYYIHRQQMQKERMRAADEF